MLRTTTTRSNTSIEERFLLRQLSPNDRAQFMKASKGIGNRDQRIDALLEKHGDQIQIPPCPNEEALYDELIEMVNACRHRSWGAQSQSNLMKYIATAFIPEIMSFADGDR